MFDLKLRRMSLKPMSEILNLFMVEERERMSELKQFQSSKGHKEKTCFQKHGKSGAGKVTNAAGGGSKVPSKCPICGVSHTCTDLRGRKHDADRLKDCPKFMKMTVLERARQIENADCKRMHHVLGLEWWP